jgi:hypothetical protein
MILDGRYIWPNTTTNRVSMPSFYSARLLQLLACVALPLAVHSQTALRMEGQVTQPRSFTAAELTALPHIEQKAKDKEGKTHRYSGVALSEILKLAGAPQGKDIHGAVLSQALLVSAADGYKVVFALPELDAAFTAQTIILADRRDGQPLPAEQGPYQIIVPQEKRPTRWVRQVASLRVVTVQP